MIQLNDVFQILADSFFNGSVQLAGVVILIAVLCFIMAFSKKLITTLVLAVPTIMMFAFLNYIPQEVGLVMLVVVALGIAMITRGAFD